MNLGRVLKRWRTVEDMTLKEAAKLMRLDEATLHRLEQGKSISAETLMSVLNFLMTEAA